MQNYRIIQLPLDSNTHAKKYGEGACGRPGYILSTQEKMRKSSKSAQKHPPHRPATLSFPYPLLKPRSGWLRPRFIPRIPFTSDYTPLPRAQPALLGLAHIRR